MSDKSECTQPAPLSSTFSVRVELQFEDDVSKRANQAKKQGAGLKPSVRVELEGDSVNGSPVKQNVTVAFVKAIKKLRGTVKNIKVIRVEC